MKSSPIELRREEMVLAMAGSLHTISRPVAFPSDVNPERLKDCQVVYVEGHEEWVLVSAEGQPIGVVDCPFGHEDAWLWVQESFIKAADCDRVIFKSDLPEKAWEGVSWIDARELSKNASRFSLRIHAIKVVWANDPVQGLVQCWSLGIHTYPCGIQELPVINEPAVNQMHFSA